MLPKCIVGCRNDFDCGPDFGINWAKKICDHGMCVSPQCPTQLPSDYNAVGNFTLSNIIFAMRNDVIFYIKTILIIKDNLLQIIILDSQGRDYHHASASMICENGTKLHGLGVEKTKIKCRANYGTPKWVLSGTKQEVPRCLKPCTNNQDCNYNARFNKRIENATDEHSQENQQFVSMSKWNQTANGTDSNVDRQQKSNSTIHGRPIQSAVQDSNLINYSYSYCKSVSQNNKFCTSYTCSKLSLVRQNSGGLTLPQNGIQSLDLNLSNENLPIGHLGNLRCNSGYIFNPSELSGEISNELNVKCMEDQICGGTSWRLIDGSSVPECIEGNKATRF